VTLPAGNMAFCGGDNLMLPLLPGQQRQLSVITPVDPHRHTG